MKSAIHGMLALVVCAALPVLAAGQKDGDATQAATHIVTYPVADLLIKQTDPGPRKPSGELGALAEMLAESLDDESWAISDTRSTIVKGSKEPRVSFIPFNLSLSLIVRGTDADHKAIAERLNLLRKFSAMSGGTSAKKVAEQQKP